MQVETIGNYQLHLIAHELSGPGGWDPFVEIYRFDEQKQDFTCVIEKQHVPTQPLPSYADAIEVARRHGNTLVKEL